MLEDDHWHLVKDQAEGMILLATGREALAIGGLKVADGNGLADFEGVGPVDEQELSSLEQLEIVDEDIDSIDLLTGFVSDRAASELVTVLFELEVNGTSGIFFRVVPLCNSAPLYGVAAGGG